jgi:hypothetical protein
MERVMNNKDLFKRIKAFVNYTDEQIKKFKFYHYFDHQHKLNEDIEWYGFIFKKDITIYDVAVINNKIINMKFIIS